MRRGLLVTAVLGSALLAFAGAADAATPGEVAAERVRQQQELMVAQQRILAEQQRIADMQREQQRLASERAQLQQSLALGARSTPADDRNGDRPLRNPSRLTGGAPRNFFMRSARKIRTEPLRWKVQRRTGGIVDRMGGAPSWRLDRTFANDAPSFNFGGVR